MALGDVIAKRDGFLNQLGEAGLNSLFPNDFEYYACSLELKDSTGRTKDMLVFPVMPDSITENEVSIVNIKKTSFGVVSLFNPSFIPFDISLSGNFGRKLRVLIGNGEINAVGVSFSQPSLKGEYNPPIFNTQIKTGYGIIKILERIYRNSQSLDDAGLPHKLFFFNLALNSQNLVEFKNLSKSMNRQNNRIWNYTINLKAIAPAFKVRENIGSSIIKVAAFSVINAGLNDLMDSLTALRQQRKNQLT